MQTFSTLNFLFLWPEVLLALNWEEVSSPGVVGLSCTEIRLYFLSVEVSAPEEAHMPILKLFRTSDLLKWTDF